MLVGSMEGIAQVHEESRALPAEANLDVRVRPAGVMKEICSCNSDRMTGPTLEAIVGGIQVEDPLSSSAQEGSCGVGRDVRVARSSARVGGHREWGRASA
jgi:hypothetical protein